jgi:scyllo-inositol 2-dehydrogenase (NADP+)
MKIAIVGVGNQGKKRMRIAADDVVCSVDPYNTDAQYREIKDVPLDDYEAALVCTSDEVKLQVVEYLIAHGKHVLVEKPMLASAGELRLLKALVLENDVTFYTAYNHRFEPHIGEVKAILDSGQLGEIYLAKLFYGNGTARDVRGTWRDEGLGVLADLGSHLLDIVSFLFPCEERVFEAKSLNTFENKGYDHVSFGSAGLPLIEIEATMLSWRNTFALDLLGGRGSVHIDCLCKWGPSTLTVRERKLPSGKPDEERKVLECDDPTWSAEYLHFKEICKDRTSSLDNDIWINDVIRSLAKVGKIQWQ